MFKQNGPLPSNQNGDTIRSDIQVALGIHFQHCFAMQHGNAFKLKLH
jgi:hypothetical protein